MKSLRRIALWLAATGGAIVLALAALAILTAAPGDPRLFPAQGEDGIGIHLVSHGYHSGLVLPRRDLGAVAAEAGLPALIGVAVRFEAYPSVEVGWGEERFYREVPTIAALNWRLALSALFGRGNASVLHVVGLWDEVDAMFPQADIVAIRLSREGFRRLLDALEASFAQGPDRQPIDLGPGLYGPSLFYRANGAFHIANVCNHWSGRLLAAAGLPATPVLATLPFGLILGLRLRSGLGPMPKRQAAAPLNTNSTFTPPNDGAY